jgi:hypothetical protein
VPPRRDTWCSAATYDARDLLAYLAGVLLATVLERRPPPAPHHGLTVQYPVTPDGRYFVVRGLPVLTTDPTLPADEARPAHPGVDDRPARGRGARARGGNPEETRQARAAVRRGQAGAGERGPVCGATAQPTTTGRMAKNTPYAQWYAALGQES